MPDILQRFQLEPGFLAHLTSVIQFGFITGTFVFALLAIADRFSPSRVFFVCSLLAGLFNLGIALPGVQPTGILLFRFLDRFFSGGHLPGRDEDSVGLFSERTGQIIRVSGWGVGAWHGFSALTEEHNRAFPLAIRRLPNLHSFRFGWIVNRIVCA